MRHQLIETPPITPLVIKHRLVFSYYSTSICAPLPADVEASPYGTRLSALVGQLGRSFPLSLSKTQALLDQLLGVEIDRRAITTIRRRLSAALAQQVAEALQASRQQPEAYVDATSAPTLNADGDNPTGKRGWVWVMASVFVHSLSRSGAAAIELLGNAFGCIVLSDRFSADNHLPAQQRQLCWAHLIRDLTAAIAERSGASAQIGAELLEQQHQVFAACCRCKARSIGWPALRQSCRPIRLAFEATLQRVVALGCQGASERRGPRRCVFPLLATAASCRWFVDLSGNRGDPTHHQRR